MAAEYPTLVDLASRLDPKGEIIPIAEVLSKRDPILKLLRCCLLYTSPSPRDA